LDLVEDQVKVAVVDALEAVKHTIPDSGTTITTTVSAPTTSGALAMVVEFPTPTDVATMEEAKPTVAEATMVVAVAALVVVVMAATMVDEDSKAVVSSKDVAIKAMVATMDIKAVAMAMVISKAEATTTTTVEVTTTVVVVPTMANSSIKAMVEVSSIMTVIIMSLWSSWSSKNSIRTNIRCKISIKSKNSTKSSSNRSKSLRTSIGLTTLEQRMDTLTKENTESKTPSLESMERK